MTKTALLVVDVQIGLDDPKFGKRNNLNAEQNMVALLTHWRNKNLPVIHVKHNSTSLGSPLRPELPGNAIKPDMRPQGDEPLIEKTVNSAFIGTDLETHLKNEGIGSLVVIGLTTDHCVSTTVRMGANLGFDMTLVADGTATFERHGYDGTYFSADEMHNINLAALNGEFCTVKPTADILETMNG